MATNRKLLAMAIIAVFSPGLLINVSAATMINQSNLTYNNDLQAAVPIVTPVAAAVAVDYSIVRLQLATLVSGKTIRPNPVAINSHPGLRGGALKLVEGGSRLAAGQQLSISDGRGKALPLPANRGKPMTVQAAIVPVVVACPPLPISG